MDAALPYLIPALLAAQLGLFAWIGKKWDSRLTAVEQSMRDMSLIMDRGERHERDLADLREKYTVLAVEVASRR